MKARTRAGTMSRNTDAGGRLVLGLALAVAGLLTSGGYGADWYDGAWRSRQPVNIAAGLADSELTNFPVLVHITNTSHAVFVQARASGADILFTDASGTNKLAHEIERFQTGDNPELCAWVRLPRLPPGGAKLYLYCGHPVAPDQQDRAGVWDSHYKGVWHLNEPAPHNGVNADSTAYANHGRRNDANGSGTGNPGQIAGGGDFEGLSGTDDYVEILNSGSLDIYGTANPVTLSAWIRFAHTNQSPVIIGKGGYPYEYRFGYNASTKRIDYTVNQDNIVKQAYLTTDASLTNWAHWVGVYDGVSLKLYRNGSVAGTTAHSGSVAQKTEGLFFGNFSGKNNLYAFGGQLDEIRVANTARSAAWIVAEYRTAASPGDYLVFGDEESVPPAAAAPWYDRAWRYRQRVAVTDLSSQPLTNFPVLIRVADAGNPLFALAREDGTDILFTDATGTNKLAHEIERFETGAAPGLFAWVRVPVLPPGGVLCFVYYGRSAAPDQQNRAGVWDSHFKGVWHLSEAAAHNGVNADSTIHANHGRRNDANGSGTGGAGPVAGAGRFDGVDDYVEIPDCGSLDIYGTNKPVTLSAWLRLAHTNQSPIMIAKGIYPNYAYRFGFSQGLLKTDFAMNDNGTAKFLNGDADASATNWFHLTGVYDGTAMRIYRNGILRNTLAHSGIVLRGASPLGIGRYHQGGYFLNGQVDEVRVANTARSDAWIAAEYRSVSAPGNHLAFDGQEARAPLGTLILLR